MAVPLYDLKYDSFSLLFQVEKLVLIDASVYTEGTGNMANFPKWLAYAGVSLLLYY